MSMRIDSVISLIFKVAYKFRHIKKNDNLYNLRPFQSNIFSWFSRIESLGLHPRVSVKKDPEKSFSEIA